MTGGVYLRGTIYWIHYRVDGERIYESSESGDRRVAERLLAQRRREIRSGTWMRPRAPSGAITVAAYIEGWIAKRERSGVRGVRNEAQPLRRFAIPLLGQMRMMDVERRHIVAFMDRVRVAPHMRTGEPLSDRSQLAAYDALRTAFGDAVIDGVIAVSPCTLRRRRGELPAKRDKGHWRSEAVYDRDAVRTLVRDERIPIDRRALYALMLLAGMRANEANGIRWRDYDSGARPLGKLTIRTQAEAGKSEAATKTGKVLYVPVVPDLAAVLAEWRAAFAAVFLRAPRPDDPIVPSRRGVDRFRIKTHATLCADLRRLGLRQPPKARHSMRATFLTLLEASGADMSIAERATHGAPTSVVGGYVRTQWAELCREVGKLRLDGDSGGDNPGGGQRIAEQNGTMQTPGAGLEGAISGGQPWTFATLDDDGFADGLRAVLENAGPRALETQSAPHVTAMPASSLAYAAWARADAAALRAEMEAL